MLQCCDIKRILRTHFKPSSHSSQHTSSLIFHNELFVDFGDFTVWQVNGKEFMGYETSAPGTTGGMVSSGEGLWTTDLSHPLLQKMAKDLGTDLTPEACADRYAQTWNEEHSGSTEVRKKLW